MLSRNQLSCSASEAGEFNYEATLASSLKGAWQLDDVLRADQELDFTRNFMPESLARTGGARHARRRRAAHPQPDPRPRISQHLRRGRGVHPALRARPCAPAAARRRLAGARAAQFRGEEAKHIQLFKRFHAAFVRGFRRVPGYRPVGSDRRRSASPRSARGRAPDPDDRVDDAGALSRHDPRRRRPRSAVQEPAAASLDRGSAARQARHADRRSAGRRPQRGRDRQRDGRLLRDRRLPRQRPQPRPASTSTRSRGDRPQARRTAKTIVEQQHQAARWTYLGSGMVHERFKATLGDLSPGGRPRRRSRTPFA